MGFIIIIITIIIYCPNVSNASNTFCIFQTALLVISISNWNHHQYHRQQYNNSSNCATTNIHSSNVFLANTNSNFHFHFSVYLKKCYCINGIMIIIINKIVWNNNCNSSNRRQQIQIQMMIMAWFDSSIHFSNGFFWRYLLF